MQKLFKGLAFGQSVTAEYKGFTIAAQVVADDDTTPPWERDSQHGLVRDGSGSDGKAPGELILSANGRGKQFYDFAEACRLALRDGWGIHNDTGMTAKEVAAEAARQNFNWLKAWCNDDWWYVGVVLEVSKAGVTLGDASLWGIESDAGDYLAEVSAELLPEAIDAARAKLKELCTC